jgi:hypothetical protein
MIGDMFMPDPSGPAQGCAHEHGLLVVVVVRSAMGSDNILCWNVRGLHARAHHDAVRELVRAELISFVCLQETRMDAFSDFDIMQLLGSGFEYSYLLAAQTRGGVLLA